MNAAFWQGTREGLIVIAHAFTSVMAGVGSAEAASLGMWVPCGILGFASVIMWVETAHYWESVT